MAHEIDTTTGTAAVFAAGTAPWHGLGRVVADAVGSAHAIDLAGLGWRVEQWPVSAVAPDGWGTVAARSVVANVRADTKAVLGVVGRTYKPFQNAEAFAFADAVVGEGKARYESAGSLRGGRRVWLLLKLPGEVRAGPDDVVKPYLLVHNTFDGSGCLRAVLTGVRVVCQNTLTLALGTARGEGVTVRHRGDLAGRVEDARRTLGLADRRLAAFGREVEVLRGVPMAGGRLDRYFDGLLPPAGPDAGEKERHNRLRTLDRLHANFGNDLNGLPGVRGTLWAAFNAVSEWADHDRRPRGATDLARRENRLEGVWFGAANAAKQAAWRAALELAGLN
ncbi:MAG: phage/plasmid-related protein [Phycisphaerales bacterium]|nr:phage/plasmid-related protein [Phycisphaerales bacterium]